MALTFGAGATDVVATSDFFTLASGITVAAWIYPTTLTNGRRISGKEAASQGWFWTVQADGDHQLAWLRATTNMAVRADAGLSTNKWWCVAATWDMDTGTPLAYTGDLTTALAEPATYQSQQAGSGALTGTSGLTYRIGNSHLANTPFQGSIATTAVWNRVLSLAELLAWQHKSRPTNGCVAFHRLGDAGTGTQPDLSGNGGSGTVTGATLADNPPGVRWGTGRGRVYVPAGGGAVFSPYYLHYYRSMVLGVN